LFRLSFVSHCFSDPRAHRHLIVAAFHSPSDSRSLIVVARWLFDRSIDCPAPGRHSWPWRCNSGPSLQLRVNQIKARWPWQGDARMHVIVGLAFFCHAHAHAQSAGWLIGDVGHSALADRAPVIMTPGDARSFAAVADDDEAAGGSSGVAVHAGDG